jgi:hypothetical protein
MDANVGASPQFGHYLMTTERYDILRITGQRVTGFTGPPVWLGHLIFADSGIESELVKCENSLQGAWHSVAFLGCRPMTDGVA